MESDIFNQSEVKFYGEVYNYLKRTVKNDSTGNISSYDVHSFLLASTKLPNDIIEQIDDVTGGTLQGWYSEKQLFLALKLVAAAQQNIPISTRIPFSDIDLPLPDLFITNNNTHHEIRREEERVKDSSDSPSPNLIQLSDSDCPVTLREEDGYQMMVSDDLEEDEVVEGFYSEPTSNVTSQSPSAYSPASDSPTPTNSVHEKNWSQSHTSQWPNLVGNEEHHQLLGTEEDSSEKHSSEERDLDDEEKEKGDNEPQSNEFISEPEEEEEVWSMTEEQQQYYTHHFTSMQPDLSGFIPGTVAKQFFEKSKLPVTELSQIWQLCDVTRDGALSLEEFYAAMHLVVLRRNKISLPNKLPPCLMPKSCRWTKFADSPTSTLSSPGPRPVNFDFQNSAVEKNPQILHPTPLRVTPEARSFEKPEDEGFSEEREKKTLAERSSHTVNDTTSGNTFDLHDSREEQTPPSHRSKGSDALSTSLINTSKFAENGSFGPMSLPFSMTQSVTCPTKKDLPPPPPPRPSKTHTRSSSLDLNKLNTVMFSPVNASNSGSPNSGGMLTSQYAPSTVTKDKSISKISEDTQVTSRNLRNTGVDTTRASAFEVYKKPQGEDPPVSHTKDSSSDEDDTVKNTSSVRLSDKRNILSALYTKREKNAVLQRLNSELNQELAEVIEERISLEFQLEQMKHLS